jgi:hypothetical protein
MIVDYEKSAGPRIEPWLRRIVCRSGLGAVAGYDWSRDRF